MLESTIIEGVFKITLALLGVVLGRLVLIAMDRFFVPPKFTEWLENANDQARAIYYGSRIVGVYLVVGLALS